MDVCDTPAETEVHDVKLFKKDSGLGITVAGYVCHEEDISGIFVKEISKGSAADVTGNIQINDRIVKVNGMPVTALTNCQAIEILKNSGPAVVISVERYPRDHKCDTLQQSTSILQLCVSPTDEANFSNMSQEGQELSCEDAVVQQLWNIELRPDLPTTTNADEETQGKHSSTALAVASDDSDFEPSYKSISEEDFRTNFGKQRDVKQQQQQQQQQQHQVLLKTDNSLRSESSCIYLSKVSDDTEKDGYETCMDESLSDDVCAKSRIGSYDEKQHATNDNVCSDVNSNDQRFCCAFLETKTFSEPCLNDENLILTEWDINNVNSDSKSYDSAETDEFFLVQCLDEDVSDLELKCLSETYVSSDLGGQKKRTYHCLRLREYYNDYEDCLEDYRCYIKHKNSTEEMMAAPANAEEEEDIRLGLKVADASSKNANPPRNLRFVKSNSAPDIPGWVRRTNATGPANRGDRRHSHLPISGCNHWTRSEDMTVTSKQQRLCPKKESGTSQTMLDDNWGSQKTIRMRRNSQENLGISIVCGRVDLYNSDTSLGVTSGIFVKGITPSGIADRTGQFRVGDRILEVNGIDLRGASHEQAVEVVRNACSPIAFVVQSLVSLVADEEQVPPSSCEGQDETVPAKEDELAANRTDTSTNDARLNDEGDAAAETELNQSEDVQNRITLANDEIVSDTEEEEDEFGYTTDKIKKKYSNLGNAVMMVQLERGQQGLGLSLAGHKDRNCMAVFVCGLNPNGVAYRTGEIQVGDEILEVNGIVLHGRCHLNASAIIKGLAGPVFKILILRRKAAIEDVAVRPVTHFPASFQEQVAEDKFDVYPNVRSVVLQKGGRNLGIMIIEGKHSELGQGIFVSDIQGGSAAEKAGLEIGEMILAVNGESLLGASYDIAASLLRKTEGAVKLTVSNPVKRAQSPIPGSDTDKENKIPSPALAVTRTSGPPSRAITPVPEPIPVDPATSPILPGKSTAVEITTDNKGLGLFFVGGKDTPISAGIAVLEVFPDGTAHKDGRIKAGDQILEANGTCLKNATAETALQTLRQTLPKMKLVIYRPDSVEFEAVEADLTKKPGKGLGLSLTGKSCGEGVYVSEILNGGNADVDGRITRGDLLVAVNGRDVQSATVEEAGCVLKTVAGKVTFKFCRLKPALR